MRFGSVCSGIEAASQAWNVLGWQAEFFSEIEAFPSAVLAHHHPDVPNHGDMTLFQEWPDHAIDLLVGGTPCQSFSVAGLRAGLADPRGNLMLTYLAIAARYRPRWLVWENVPGVLSSNGGRDFGTFLGGLGELGYGFAYRVLDAQFCRAHGYERAVPQRRKRVFVVGYLGDWRRAAAVLFDGQSLRGDPAPSRKAGQGLAVCPTLRAGGNRTGGDRPPGTDVDTADSLIAVAHALRGEGFDASEDGTGRGTPLVPVAFDTTQITSKANVSNPKPGDPCHPLAAGAHAPAIALQSVNTPREKAQNGIGVSDEGAMYSLTARDQHAVQRGWAVRRLLPVECERLQGFKDNHTLVPYYRGRMAADGPRYKALGNSMAVNVMRVIGTRIQMVEQAA